MFPEVRQVIHPEVCAVNRSLRPHVVAQDAEEPFELGLGRILTKPLREINSVREPALHDKPGPAVLKESE